MGFFTIGMATVAKRPGVIRRNPFQGGMGFFTGSSIKVPWWAKASRNPFQGGMGFFTPVGAVVAVQPYEVAIPFRVGWGFSPLGRTGTDGP